MRIYPSEIYALISGLGIAAMLFVAASSWKSIATLTALLVWEAVR